MESFKENSTECSLSDLGQHQHHFLLSAQFRSTLEIPTIGAVSEANKEAIRQHFPSARNSDCEFYNIIQGHPPEENLILAECFLSSSILYVNAESCISRQTFQKINNLAE